MIRASRLAAFGHPLLPRDNARMKPTPLLRITKDALAGILTPQQERFNALVREVETARANLAEWQKRIERSDLQLAPLRQELHLALRQWVAALDTATLQPGMSRAERSQLSELIRDATAELRDDGEDDDGTSTANPPAPPPSQASDDDEPWRAAAEAGTGGGGPHRLG